MSGWGVVDRFIARLLAVLPPVFTGLAIVVALAVLAGFLPFSPFLALAVLLLAVGLYLALARQARLEDMAERALARPRRFLENMDKRLRSLERQVEELLRAPATAAARESGAREPSAPRATPPRRARPGPESSAPSRPQAADAETVIPQKKARPDSSPPPASAPSAADAADAAESVDMAEATDAERTLRPGRTDGPPAKRAARASGSAETSTSPASNGDSAETPARARAASVPEKATPASASSEGPAGTMGAKAAPEHPLAATARDLLAGFQLFMEPVVDRFAHRTAFYRAVPALRNARGLCLGPDAHLLAARNGFARALDRHTLAAALAFLGHMRARDLRLPVIVPLSYDFLIAPDARDRLAALLETEPTEDLLALEIPQQAMATLGERAVRLVAWLAERGVRMSLGHADPCHMDARALSALGFVWCDVPRSVLQEALRLRCRLPVLPQVVVSGLHARRDLEGLPAAVRLVRGRAFAAPRRVREEVWRGRAGLRHAA
jgi:EAL domain-containing protein (putative c-di-GMP-specific phosphodiesterase class I)